MASYSGTGTTHARPQGKALYQSKLGLESSITSRWLQVVRVFSSFVTKISVAPMAIRSSMTFAIFALSTIEETATHCGSSRFVTYNFLISTTHPTHPAGKGEGEDRE